MPNEFIVPLDGLYDYTKSNDWEPYRPLMKSRLGNYDGKKVNYKKAVKHLKKAAKFLPLEFVIEVKVDVEQESKR